MFDRVRLRDSVCVLMVCGLFLWTAVFSGCRPQGPSTTEEVASEGTNNPDGDGGNTEQTPTEKPVTSGLSVMDLQDPSSPNRPAEKAAVILKGLVVTSQMFVLDRKDNQVVLNGFFVSDPSFPSKFGGILVSVGPDFSTRLDLGDVIDVTGTFKNESSFYNTQIDARELSGGIVTKTSENKKDAIKAVTLTAADLPSVPTDVKNPDASKAEPYEGMLVEIKNVEVEADADQYGVWKIVGGAEVDDTFYRGVRPTKGTKLAYVRGILNYAFDKYTILPRGALDIEGGKPTCQSDTDCSRSTRCLPTLQECQVIICKAQGDCRSGETCNAQNRCEAPAQDLTIADIQDPASSKRPRIGDALNLKSVLVTTPVFNVSANLKGFFVSDANGPAKFGGVMVVVAKDFAETLAIGDGVDIKGKMEEYFFNTQIDAQASTGGEVKKTGSNAKDKIVPVALTTAELPADPTDKANPDTSPSEPYEGVLVEFKNVEVETEPDKNGVFTLKGGVSVDDVIFAFKPKKGDVLAFLRGTVQYSFDKYRVLPRSADDIAGAQVTCTKNEDCPAGQKCGASAKCEVITCQKNEDCRTGETCNTTSSRCEAPPQARTVADLQDASRPTFVKEGDRAELKGVVVTSSIYNVSANLKGFYVADPSFPAKFGGLLVVVGKDFAEALAPGDVVDLQGSKQEYFKNTQFNAGTGGKVTKTGQTATLKYTELTVADLPADPVDKANPDTSPAEAYEGMLVELKNVEVDTDPDANGAFKLVGGATVDDTLYKHVAKKGDKIGVLRGIVIYSFDQYRILPRSADDVK
ncbi:hypothetical protein L6R29_24860 [Myxococcota bacterium]|nr:hypothetical protein [Myxococcota bacterium]